MYWTGLLYWRQKFHYREEENATRVRARYHPRENLDTRKTGKNISTTED